jgi:hypothetical protein
MNNLSQYIIEKLHLNKNLKSIKSKEEILVYIIGCMGFHGFEEKHIKENDPLTKEIYKWIDDNSITEYPKYYVDKDHAKEGRVLDEYLKTCIDDPQVISDILEYLLNSTEKSVAETNSLEVYKVTLKGSFIPDDMENRQECLFIYQKLQKFGALFLKDDKD